MTAKKEIKSWEVGLYMSLMHMWDYYQVLGTGAVKMIYTVALMSFNYLLCFDIFLRSSPLYMWRPMDNRSLSLKSQQKELTLFTAGCTLFVIYSSPLRQKSFTWKRSCCHILEPLLCMSRITLIHPDHWLIHTSLNELPKNCPLPAVWRRPKGRKRQSRR